VIFNGIEQAETYLMFVRRKFGKKINFGFSIVNMSLNDEKGEKCNF